MAALNITSFIHSMTYSDLIFRGLSITCVSLPKRGSLTTKTTARSVPCVIRARHRRWISGVGAGQTSLPHKAGDALHNVFDFIRYTTFTVCYRRSMLDAPVKIKELELRDIHIAKVEKMMVEVTIDVEKDLIGKFTALDRHTKREISVVFDG
jgi:hypothetical protein